MARVRRMLSSLEQDSPASLRAYRPRPTAAFSPRDTTHPHYHHLTSLLGARGFAPAERGAGGQLAIYDEAALVIDLVAPHAQPRDHTRERYRLFSASVASALASLGLDARVGAVEGEYCAGDYSVNAGGRVKLVGVAQRVAKHGYHLGAVISVAPSPAALAAVAEAYGIMGVAFDPVTFGDIVSLSPVHSITGACQKITDLLAAEVRASQT